MALGEIDHLAIGAGATGLAFADTLLPGSDARITLVDMNGQPGGHGNDVDPFGSLHLPSAFYGVGSLALVNLREITVGHNVGMCELASGTEVNGRLHQVMQPKWLPSGRVRFLPMSRFEVLEAGTARVTSLL